MRRKFKLYMALMVMAVAQAPLQTQAASGETIAVIVNQEAISASDVRDRMELIIKSSGLQGAPDIQEKIKPQIINSLIEEQIKIQEAKAQDISITDAEIAEGVAQIAKQNNIPPDKFKEMLARSGVNINTMHNQIRAQIGWSKVVQKVLFPKINISDVDVEDATARMKGNLGRTEYLLAEIYLPFENPSQADEAGSFARKLVAEMQSGKAPFFKVAQQFSKSAGAANGGDMGWVQEGNLDPAIEQALQGMEKSKLSDAIRTATGYHILFLRDKRSITEATMPTVQEIRNTIGMERLERMQRRYYMDLKSRAFIESRV